MVILIQLFRGKEKGRMGKEDEGREGRHGEKGSKTLEVTRGQETVRGGMDGEGTEKGK